MVPLEEKSRWTNKNTKSKRDTKGNSSNKEKEKDTDRNIHKVSVMRKLYQTTQEKHFGLIPEQLYEVFQFTSRAKHFKAKIIFVKHTF